MLHYLHIKNIALVDEIEIEFEKGLNVVTGETGAGKSVIVGSMNFILGERFDSGQIRSGADKALIEAVFDISKNRPLLNYLEEAGIDFDAKEFLVKREMSSEGKGRCFVCGSVITLGMLKEVGDLLVDIHGQHDHQSLLDPLRHTGILDRFGGTSEFCEKVRDCHGAFVKLKAKRDDIRDNAEARKRELEFLKFQLDEIVKADIKEDEDSELEKEFEILRNAARLKELSSAIFSQLYESDGSMIGMTGKVEAGLAEIAGYEPELEPYAKGVGEAVCQLKEAADAVRRFRDRVEINEERLNEVEQRLVFIERLKKKHGGSLRNVLDRRDELAGKVGSIEGSDEELRKTEEDLDKASAALKKASSALSAKRSEAAKKLSGLIRKELEMLGMSGTDFKAEIIPCEPGPNGAERIEFFISPNKGEALKPLKSIASGGEISRVMLAIKKIIAYTDGIPTLVFDEIDVNIGGRLANTVGERLKDIAGEKQVVCITHLPQIARCGDNHLYVEKKVSGGRTLTSIKKLIKDDRKEEIARMLGGSEGGAAEEFARELLGGK